MLTGKLAKHPVTISIGVSQHRPREELTTLIARSDKALYRAKQAGRNRVVVIH